MVLYHRPIVNGGHENLVDTCWVVRPLSGHGYAWNGWRDGTGSEVSISPIQCSILPRAICLSRLKLIHTEIPM